MTNEKDMQQLIDQVIQEERKTDCNPFLSTRVMAAIDTKNSRDAGSIFPTWKTALVAASLMVAVFTGIATGSLYQPNNDTGDVVMLNDNSMENFSFYNQTENE